MLAAIDKDSVKIKLLPDCYVHMMDAVFQIAGHEYKYKGEGGDK